MSKREPYELVARESPDATDVPRWLYGVREVESGRVACFGARDSALGACHTLNAERLVFNDLRCVPEDELREWKALDTSRRSFADVVERITSIYED